MFLVLIIVLLGVWSCEGVDTFDSLASGAYHTCDIQDNQDVYCWGDNSEGQLGVGYTSAYEATPVQMILYGVKQKKVCAGLAHTCVLSQGGYVKCVGRNDNGQLGLGDFSRRTVANDPASFTHQGSVVDIACGNQHTCITYRDALDGYYYGVCAGWAEYGQLGDGVDYSTPPPANRRRYFDHPMLTWVTSWVVDGGGRHTCILFLTNVLCTGDNSYGQIGLSSSVTQKYTLENAWLQEEMTYVSAVSTGNFHTCVVSVDYDVYCTGANYIGQLGRSGTFDSASSFGFIPVGGGFNSQNVIESVLAKYDSTCVVEREGEFESKVFCFGNNVLNKGMLGVYSGSTWAKNLRILEPSRAMNNHKSQYVSLGQNHACVRLSTLEVYCGGDNSVGQLGDNQYAYGSNPPIQSRVLGLPITEIPTSLPTSHPTQSPSLRPSDSPSTTPTLSPTIPTYSPSGAPTPPTTFMPTSSPTPFTNFPNTIPLRGTLTSPIVYFSFGQRDCLEGVVPNDVQQPSGELSLYPPQESCPVGSIGVQDVVSSGPLGEALRMIRFPQFTMEMWVSFSSNDSRVDVKQENVTALRMSYTNGGNLTLGGEVENEGETKWFEMEKRGLPVILGLVYVVVEVDFLLREGTVCLNTICYAMEGDGGSDDLTGYVLSRRHPSNTIRFDILEETTLLQFGMHDRWLNRSVVEDLYALGVPNSEPIVSPRRVYLREDEATRINLTVTDRDGDVPVGFRVDTLPTRGVLRVEGRVVESVPYEFGVNETLTYVNAEANAFSENETAVFDRFRVSASDGKCGACLLPGGEMEMIVLPVEDDPQVYPQELTVVMTQFVEFELEVEDVDGYIPGHEGSVLFANGTLKPEVNVTWVGGEGLYRKEGECVAMELGEEVRLGRYCYKEPERNRSGESGPWEGEGLVFEVDDGGGRRSRSQINVTVTTNMGGCGGSCYVSGVENGEVRVVLSGGDRVGGGEEAWSYIERLPLVGVLRRESTGERLSVGDRVGTNETLVFVGRGDFSGTTLVEYKVCGVVLLVCSSTQRFEIMMYPVSSTIQVSGPAYINASIEEVTRVEGVSMTSLDDDYFLAGLEMELSVGRSSEVRFGFSVGAQVIRDEMIAFDQCESGEVLELGCDRLRVVAVPSMLQYLLSNLEVVVSPRVENDTIALVLSGYRGDERGMSLDMSLFFEEYKDSEVSMRILTEVPVGSVGSAVFSTVPILVASVVLMFLLVVFCTVYGCLMTPKRPQ